MLRDTFELVDHLDRLCAHEVSQLAAIVVVLVADVSQRLLAAANGLELGDTDTGAVELANNILGVDRCSRRVFRVLWNVVTGPQQWQRLVAEIERFHETIVDIAEKFCEQVGILGIARFVKGVGRIAANGREAAFRLFVNHHLAHVTGHEDADFALRYTR